MAVMDIQLLVAFLKSMLIILQHKHTKERTQSCYSKQQGYLTVVPFSFLVLFYFYRYLLKISRQKVPQAQLPNNVAYLAADYPKYKESPVLTPKQFNDPHILLEAYRQRVIR